MTPGMLDSFFLYVADLLSTPPDHIKLVTCLLAAYPLSSLYVRLPKDQTRHWFSIGVALFFLVGVLKLYNGTAQVLASIVGTYLIVCFNRTARMPWLVFAFTMTHLLCNHIYRTIHAITPDVIEITGTQMVLVMKLVSFAWAVADGRRDVNELDAAQLATRLTKVPGLHSFIGYCLFFPSILVGPSFDFTLYHSLVNGTLFLDPPDSKKKDKSVSKSVIPTGRKRVAYVHMAVGLAFMTAYALLGSKATYSGVLEDSWWTYGVGFKLLYVQACGFMARIKYYAVWELAEGAVILCGLGFNGYDPVTGRSRWNRCRNVDILRIETAENYKVLFDSWNMRTSVWLRECVYKRITPKNQKPGFQSSIITFMTSALWHGTQPGYYISFFHGGILTALGKLFRRNMRPLLLEPAAGPVSAGAVSGQMAGSSPVPASVRGLLKKVYDALGWLSVQLTLNYLASSFILLDLSSCFKFFQRTWFYGDVAIILSYAFFKLGGGAALKAASKRQSAGPLPTKLEHIDLKKRDDETPNDLARSAHPSIVISPPMLSPPASKVPLPNQLLSASLPGASDPIASGAESNMSPSGAESAESSETSDDWEHIGDSFPPPAEAGGMGGGFGAAEKVLSFSSRSFTS